MPHPSLYESICIHYFLQPFCFLILSYANITCVNSQLNLLIHKEEVKELHVVVIVVLQFSDMQHKTMK